MSRPCKWALAAHSRGAHTADLGLSQNSVRGSLWRCLVGHHMVCMVGWHPQSSELTPLPFSRYLACQLAKWGGCCGLGIPLSHGAALARPHLSTPLSWKHLPTRTRSISSLSLSHLSLSLPPLFPSPFSPYIIRYEFVIDPVILTPILAF